MPTVDTVTWRGEIFNPVGGNDPLQGQAEVVIIEQRLAHAHEHQVQLAGVSPSSFFSVSTWETISPALRLRRKPMVPVAQKRQARAQPTWVDRQKV